VNDYDINGDGAVDSIEIEAIRERSQSCLSLEEDYAPLQGRSSLFRGSSRGGMISACTGMQRISEDSTVPFIGLGRNGPSIGVDRTEPAMI